MRVSFCKHLLFLESLLIFYQFEQTECATIGQLISFWNNPTTNKPRIDLPKRNNNTNHTSSSTPSIVTPDYYSFKGTAYDRTESSLYPTTAREDKEFMKWEEEEEIKYALAQQKLKNFRNDGTDNESNNNNHYLRQETDNEKIVASFFGNRPSPPIKTNHLFPIFSRWQQANRMRPMVQSFIQYFGGGSNNGSSSTSSSLSSNTTTNTSTPLFMNIINSIRIPTMSPVSEAKLQEQMQKLKENWVKRDIVGALNETLKIATPILYDNPNPLGSLINGIVDFVRCNTVDRLNNTNNCN